MNKPKHTPGPWLVGNPTVGEFYICTGGSTVLAQVLDDSDTTYCSYYKVGLKEAEANARLIAACPDLLDALKEAVSDCKCSVKERASGHRIDCNAPRWIEIISRAEGRGE